MTSRFVSPRAHGPQPHVLAVVLAGGEGRRLFPLTADRAKPAVPIGGRYRLIDFVLSNLVNSGLLRIKVLTQYKSDSLNSHIARGWRLPAMLNLYVEAVPAQQRMGKEWFRGSADAMWQSMNILTDESPDLVAIFGGDHMYKMDVGQMIDFHQEREADVTVAAMPVPVDEARAFGIIEVNAEGEIISFTEKPEHPKEIPGRPGWALASLGNYVFGTDALLEEMKRVEQEGAHDFGRNILPSMVGRARCFCYDFASNVIPGEEGNVYWRDVGTIESYWKANMDLVAVTPPFNTYNPRWPIHTFTGQSLPPAKFVFADAAGGELPRIGTATDSLVCEGVILSGGRIHRSILGPSVRVNSYAHVEESILFEGVDIGRHARIRRAIIDKGVHIPAGTEIGYDREEDARRFHVGEDGIVVVAKGTEIRPPESANIPLH